MPSSRKQLEAQILRLDRRLNQLLLAVSLQRQAFQRFVAETDFEDNQEATVYRRNLTGDSVNVFHVPAEDFPIPSLEGLLKNILVEGPGYVG